LGLQNYKETPSQPKIKSTKKSNFSIEEDILLVKAWIRTSINPIQETDKKCNKFWNRICMNYHENKKENTVERTVHSLSNRWSSIQKFTNKFYGYLAQVETKNPSGATEQDKVKMNCY
jgi:DNA replication protein DnaD